MRSGALRIRSPRRTVVKKLKKKEKMLKMIIGIKYF
jgi:hypothetical protein